MVYLVEFHAITKILLTLREITKKITKKFQLPKKSENCEILPKVIKITESGHTAQLVNLCLSETIRTSIIALNMVPLTTEQRTFVIKTFYETSTLQKARVAFGLINFA